MSQPPSDDLKEQANRQERGMVADFVDFVLHNKKWWLIPTLILLLMLAGFVVLGSTGAAPFIYSLF